MNAYFYLERRMKKLKGQLVTDAEAIDYYMKAGERIEHLLGTSLYGFDPDFVFRTSDGRTTFNLPVDVVDKLLEVTKDLP